MGDAAFAFLGIVLFCITIFAVVQLYVGWRRRSLQWQITEGQTIGGKLTIELKRANCRSIVISAEDDDNHIFNSVADNDPEWDVKVALLRDEAKYKLRTLNGQ